MSRRVELTRSSVRIIQESLTGSIGQWQAFRGMLHTTDAEKELLWRKVEEAGYALMELHDGHLPDASVPCLSCFTFNMATEACPNAKDICLNCCGEEH